MSAHAGTVAVSRGIFSTPLFTGPMSSGGLADDSDSAAVFGDVAIFDLAISAAGTGLAIFNLVHARAAVGIAHRPMNIYIVLHRNCEAATMKNITVSIDEQTHRLARIRAAELDTSVSALVRDYLRHLAAEPDAGGEASAESSETIYQRRCRLLREVLADFDRQGIGLRMSDNLPREALYDRVAGKGRGCRRTRAAAQHLRSTQNLAMRFVDTNVLLYAVSEVPEEADKRARALEVLTEPDLAASVQVLQEFYHQATRPTRIRSLSGNRALQFLEPILLFRIQTMTMDVFLEAVAISRRFRLSYWDGAILAAARTLGCDVIYSEDLSSEQDYDGLRVINPFTDR